jgi:predicted acylesterase/phospholipase RssA
MAATKSIRKGNKKALNKKEIALAIAGGGCKALYGLGVGYKLRKWGLKIKEISGVSAGSAIGLMILSGREEEGIEYFEQLLKRNKSNFRPHHLLMGKRPFPHENMYRRTLRYAIDFEKIGKSRVKIFILAVKAFPRKGKLHNYWKKLLLIPKTMRAVLLDDKDKEKGLPAHRVNQIVNDWNLKEVIFTNKDFQYPAITEQIIMNSSSIPPVLSFQRINEEYYLDGGLTNNLLLEPFSNTLKKIGIYYEDTTLYGKSQETLKNTYFIKPEGKLPIHTFDYTNAIGAREAYELGKKDAEEQKEKIFSFLDSDYE